MPAFVYILRCRDDTLYTGAVKDLRARLRRHEAGTASRYTRAVMGALSILRAESTKKHGAIDEEAKR